MSELVAALGQPFVLRALLASLGVALLCGVISFSTQSTPSFSSPQLTLFLPEETLSWVVSASVTKMLSTTELMSKVQSNMS